MALELGPFQIELVDALAAWICKRRHDGFDLWDGMADQIKDNWRSEALFYLRGVAVDIDQSRPPVFEPGNQ